MTKLAGFEEAVRRTGATPAEVKHCMNKIALAGASPWKPGELIPDGDEEMFIESCLLAKMRTDFLARSSPKFRAAMEDKLKSIQGNN